MYGMGVKGKEVGLISEGGQSAGERVKEDEELGWMVAALDRDDVRADMVVVFADELYMAAVALVGVDAEETDADMGVEEEVKEEESYVLKLK
jgi:hypothetical protein